MLRKSGFALCVALACQAPGVWAADDSVKAGRSTWTFDLRKAVGDFRPADPFLPGASLLGELEFPPGRKLTYTNTKEFPIQVELTGYGKCVGMEVGYPGGARGLSNDCQFNAIHSTFVVYPRENWSIYHANSGSPPVGAKARFSALVGGKGPSDFPWNSFTYTQGRAAGPFPFNCADVGTSALPAVFETFNTYTGEFLSPTWLPRFEAGYVAQPNTYFVYRTFRTSSTGERTEIRPYNAATTDCSRIPGVPK